MELVLIEKIGICKYLLKELCTYIYLYILQFHRDLMYDVSQEALFGSIVKYQGCYLFYCTYSNFEHYQT